MATEETKTLIFDDPRLGSIGGGPIKYALAMATRCAIVLTFLVFAAPRPAAAQDDVAARPRNFLYADLSLGVLGLGYGHDVTEWLSLQLSAQYYAPWYLLGDRVGGLGGELRVVFVPWRADEHALIVIEGARLAAAFGASGGEGIAYSLRSSVGYQLTVEWFRMQLTFGFQHHAVEGLDPSTSFAGLYPSVDLFFGVML